MKVTVDYERCQGNGLCIQAAPEIFDMGDDDDQVRLLQESPGEDCRSQVNQAVQMCPTRALDLED